MKILHVVDSLNPKSGGLATATLQNIKSINIKGVKNTILTYKDFHNYEFESVKIVSFQKKNSHYLNNNNPILNFLSSYDFDLIHINGLWSYLNYAAHKIAIRKNIPYIVAPHGMLYPEALKKNKLIKFLYSKVFQNKILNKSSLIHVTCLEEKENLIKLGIKGNMKIIPNGLEIHKNISAKKKTELINFVYLGRVHRRKRIERIMYALHNLKKTQKYYLHIIGSGDETYEKELRKLSVNLNLDDKITWHGFLEGDKKINVLKKMTYTVVASDFENFGMIVPESLSLGIPVITSFGTPWKIINNHCGWVCENSIQELTEILKQAIQINDSQYLTYSQNAIEFAIKFDYKKIGEKLIETYSAEIK